MFMLLSRLECCSGPLDWVCMARQWALGQQESNGGWSLGWSEAPRRGLKRPLGLRDLLTRRSGGSESGGWAGEASSHRILQSDKRRSLLP